MTIIHINQSIRVTAVIEISAAVDIVMIIGIPLPKPATADLPSIKESL